jgi:RNA polymerase sigma factor (sigma-70 family)
MTKTASGTIRDELRFLLHPADGRDVPVPGFPTHDALVAWARLRPPDELIEAAIEVLRNDDWPQQYAAMALLRALGADVEGVGYDDDFRWRLTRPGGRRARFIEPSVKERTRPLESMSTDVAVGDLDQARAAIANAIDRLPERERIILTLYYYETLSLDEVASVLGVDAHTVRRLHQKAIRAIRGSISDSVWELLGQIAHQAPTSPEAVGALALIRELTAA